MKKLKVLRAKAGALDLSQMGPALIALVIAVIVIGVLASTLVKLQSSQPAPRFISSQANNSNANGTDLAAYYILGNGTDAFLGGSTLLGPIGIIIVASVVIGLVMMFRSSS